MSDRVINCLCLSSLKASSSWVPPLTPASTSGTWKETYWLPSTLTRWPILTLLSPHVAGQCANLISLLQLVLLQPLHFRHHLILNKKNKTMKSSLSLCVQVCRVLRLHSWREGLGGLLREGRRFQGGGASFRSEGPLSRSSRLRLFQRFSQVAKMVLITV